MGALSGPGRPPRGRGRRGSGDVSQVQAALRSPGTTCVSPRGSGDEKSETLLAADESKVPLSPRGTDQPGPLRRLPGRTRQRAFRAVLPCGHPGPRVSRGRRLILHQESTRFAKTGVGSSTTPHGPASDKITQNGIPDFIREYI